MKTTRLEKLLIRVESRLKKRGSKAALSRKLGVSPKHLWAALLRALPYVESVTDDECAAYDAHLIRAAIARAEGRAS